MSALERTRLDMAIRADFATFIHMVFQTVVAGRRFLPNWHISAMAYQLTRCAGRTFELRRLHGGEGGIRTLGTGYPVRQISNLLPAREH
jgi:hypothetical protein